MKWYTINGTIGIEAETEAKAREFYYMVFTDPIVTIEEEELTYA